MTTTVEDCPIVATDREMRLCRGMSTSQSHTISHVIESKIIDVVVVLSVEYFACNYANSMCIGRERHILSYNFIKTSNNAVKYFVGLCCDC